MSAADLARHHQVSQFLFHEARLLDERRWDEWADLFTPDGVYWAPAAHDQPDAEFHVSLIHDDALLRKVRIARFADPNAFALQPFPRTAHLVTNVMIDEDDATTGRLLATSRFAMFEFRTDAQRIYGGAYRHELVVVGERFRIVRKTATLVDCEGLQETVGIYF